MARADDPTALLHNPAGLAKVKSFELFIGANLVHFKQTFDRTGVYQNWQQETPSQPSEPGFEGADMPAVESNNPIQPIPFVAVVGRPLANLPLSLALGVFAPQGYPNRDFDREVTVDGMETTATPNRYDIVKEESLAAFPSLALAYEAIPGLSFGARFSAGFSHLKAENNQWGAVNNEEDVFSDGVFTADVRDNFVPSFGFGALYAPLPWLEAGVAYNSQANLDMNGTGNATLGPRLEVGGVPSFVDPIPDEFVRCGKGGVRFDLKTCIDVVIPATLTAGVRYIFRGTQGEEIADIELDGRWEQWSEASTIKVIVDGQIDATGGELEEVHILHGFEDVYSVRLGGSYNIPLPSAVVQLRGGTSYDTAAAPVSWTRLDLDGTERLQFALGASYQRKSWKIDLGASMILSQDRDVSGEDPFDRRYDDCPVSDPTDPTCADDIKQPDRDQPDATNPVKQFNDQPFQPINNGHYESGYIIVATGFSYMW